MGCKAASLYNEFNALGGGEGWIPGPSPPAVGLKYVLGQIQANDANLDHGRSPHSGLSTPATLAHLMPPGGIHPIGYFLRCALLRSLGSRHNRPPR
jgi:hypothetical protein